MNIKKLRADFLKPKSKTSTDLVKTAVSKRLVAALEAQDNSVLKNVLQTTSIDQIKKALVETKVLVALIRNYTQESHTQLLKKGFNLSNFHEKLLFTHIDATGWENLFANTPKTKSFDNWLYALFQESLDYDFQRIYPMCKKNSAEFRMVLRQHDPLLHDHALRIFFENSEGVQGIMPINQNNLNNYSKQEWAWLKTIAKKSWYDVFQDIFYIGQTNLNLFLNFFDELPLAKQALDDVYIEAKNNKKYCMDLLSGSANDICTTALWEKLHPKEQKKLQQELEDTAQHLQQLGLNQQELFLYGNISCRLLEKISDALPTAKQKCFKYLINEGLVLTQSLSLVHFILGTEEIDTLALLGKSPKACEKVIEAFYDPMTLRSFSRATHIFQYKKLFKKFPQLATWRDQHNNTILHYALVLNPDGYAQGPANCVMDIIMSNLQLCDSNHNGVSLRDMCHLADAQILAKYDKKSMTLAIKNAAINPNRMKHVSRKI